MCRLLRCRRRRLRTPLIVDHEILNLPSASVLAVLREETANRKPASKAVAVLADPVFSASDPRLRKTTERPAEVSVFVGRTRTICC